MLISPIAVAIANENDTTDKKILFKGIDQKASDAEIHNATKLTSPSDDAPSLTVLVYGQNGKAAHWSNDSEFKEANDDSAFKFVSDLNSLIESLRFIAPNADVFRAKMNNDAQNNATILSVTQNLELRIWTMAE